MTASASPRSPSADPLRVIDAALLGTLFLGLVAMASLPGAIAGWVPPWLVAAPVAALATSCALRLHRRADGQARSAAAAVRRRRPGMAVVTRRRGAPSRRAGRLLAALVLR